MSHGTPSGLAAMPAARSQCAPRFSGQDDEILEEFLQEYEDLADGNGLSERQKVETILRYVPRSLQKLWSMLPGYVNVRWHHFRAQLEELYPDIAGCTRCMCQGLSQFVELSLTDDDFHAEFFKGFHAENQDILADQVFNINPHHPANQPFDAQDVLSAAR
ncbi:hypothetical protein EDB92DRAFT_1823619 [Lactarius akahatsu]|uniref:Uncharacterized protein n=1 Tax=Lactarius akahatsu TaxID=416441 RepID=A0AAD4Q6W9_9AGAM|nr:hypothetical protein EDB92DRAFT_1823619 [Lactarius akahatsu]